MFTNAIGFVDIYSNEKCIKFVFFSDRIDATIADSFVKRFSHLSGKHIDSIFEMS